MLRVFLFIIFIVSSNALAEDSFLSGSLNSNLQYEKISPENSNRDTTSDTFIESELHLDFKLSDNISIITEWLLYNVRDIENENRFLEDEGIVVRDIALKFHNEDAEFWIGKISPKFGALWDNKTVNFGIWGDDFSDNYRIEGKIGLSVKSKILLDDYGTHELEVSTFKTDDSSLNDSLLTNRNISNNNVGNNAPDIFSSYSVNLFGSEFYEAEGFFYNVSYRKLESETGNNDEQGISLGLGFEYNLTDDFKLKPSIEYANISNFNSVNNRFNLELSDGEILPNDYEYFSFLFSLEYSSWAINYNNLTRNSEIFNDSQEEFSVFYNFTKDLYIGLGRKDAKLLDEKEDSVGFIFGLNKSF